MANTQNVSIACRPVSKSDLADWAKLFEGYLEFYHFPPKPEVIQQVWAWLHDAGHPMQGIVAEQEGEGVAGLAHFVTWPFTLVGANTCYLSDLYTRSDLRGGGVGEKLINEVQSECERRGWSLLIWLTQETNYRGRGLYDKFAHKSEFIAYMLETKSDD